MSRTYYEVLQISPEATPDEVKEAYRALAWKTQSQGGQEALKEINDAYAVLSSPSRRAEYDKALAENALPQTPASAPDRHAPPRYLRHDLMGEGPGSHPFLRLLGGIFELSGMIAQVRYLFIPMNLILGVAAMVGAIATVQAYGEERSLQAPRPATIQQVVRNKEANQYVTVTARRSKDYWYSGKKDGITTFYWALIAGSDVLIAKGYEPPESGAYTGKLTPMPGQLQDLVKKDANSPELQGATVGTTHYLDLGYKPKGAGVYLAGIILLAAGALVLLVPPLMRYSVFSRRHGTSAGLMPEGPEWPMQVYATGRFHRESGGRATFQVRARAEVVPTDNPSYPLEVRITREVKLLPVTYVLPIPAEAEVAWGYEYGSGSPQPAVTFGKAARLCVPTEADARWLADHFATGSLKSA